MIAWSMTFSNSRTFPGKHVRGKSPWLMEKLVTSFPLMAHFDRKWMPEVEYHLSLRRVGRRWNHIESIIKVFSEVPSFIPRSDFCSWLDHPHVHLQGLLSADPFNGDLARPEEKDLGGRGNLTDLIKEDRPPSSIQPPIFRDGSCERPFSWPKSSLPKGSGNKRNNWVPQRV